MSNTNTPASIAAEVRDNLNLRSSTDIPPNTTTSPTAPSAAPLSSSAVTDLHDFDHKCLFCNIVAGKSPCYEVYSNEDVICFLDIYPLHPGHTLVIPKKHYKDLSLMPGELAAACMNVVPKVARSLMAATKTKDFNVMLNSGKLAGQEVFHAHFHIIPRSKGDSLSKTWCTWSTQPLKSELAKTLTAAIKQDINQSTAPL
ncbi:histidine triad (HIT) protein [Planoprotostelium fungivorum]|uniref:Histidine triad (HIT) protein n=1 Tax=Planoprotostelium fungivorum TaxID=1890364 RepID=A0A2P6NXK9_9EUKA|nr:histidine triad (HIT) protein [Planoprotostelium fungivorum]